jgi:hypothetical protein
MSAPRAARASRAVDRLLTTALARDRIARALYEVMAEGLDFRPCDASRRGDREWLRGVIAVPLQRATDQALHSLVWEVGQALERAPDGLLDRLLSSRQWSDEPLGQWDMGHNDHVG